MTRTNTRLSAALAATAAMAMIILPATPAAAATANGTQNCGYIYSSRVWIESSTSGDGTYQRLPAPGVTYGSFPAGTSTANAGYQSMNWALNNYSGYFYSKPYGWCA